MLWCTHLNTTLVPTPTPTPTRTLTFTVTLIPILTLTLILALTLIGVAGKFTDGGMFKTSFDGTQEGKTTMVRKVNHIKLLIDGA